MRDTGNNAEFEALALPLFDSLYNFAHWLAQDRHEAEDLVQETYAKALKGFGSFRPGTNFRAWIFKILRNTFLTSRTGLSERAYRAAGTRGRRPAAAGLVAYAGDAGDHARPGRGACSRRSRRCRCAFREVLLLADVEEMSYQEISETLTIPIGTVMSRLARARKAARQKLIESGYEQKKRTAARR